MRPNITFPVDIATLMEEKRAHESLARRDLQKLAQKKFSLKRRVFFIPGWRDEKGCCWKTPYAEGRISVQRWIEKGIANPEWAFYPELSVDRSAECTSFMEIMEHWREAIRSLAFSSEDIDVVAHSMGGLCMLACVLSEDARDFPRIHRLITLATPHGGHPMGDALQLSSVRKALGILPHHAAQALSFCPEADAIKALNQTASRRRFLNKVHCLHCYVESVGMAEAKPSRFEINGLESVLVENKIKIKYYRGAAHAGENGITQDARVLLDLLTLLTNEDSYKKRSGG